MANKLPADLESFVSKEVASLCDADPTVLAQYIIALIGNEQLDDALKASLEEKLHEFFDNQTMPFINRLFAKINGQSVNVPASMDRFNEFSDDEDDGDRNFKHRRQRSESQEEQDRSNKRRLPEDSQNGGSNKYYRANEDRRSSHNPNNIPVTGYNGHFDNNRGRGNMGGRGGRGGSNMRGGMNNMGRGQTRPQCRDYNEKGFCMRGDMCPYDHGMDRIIVDENVGAYPGPFPPGGPIPPMGVRTVPPQPFYGMPDAYDPERSGLMNNNNNNEMVGFPGMPNMMNPNDMMMNNGMMRGNGMRRGRGGRGGARGGYQGHRHQNNNPQNTTLNVEKIPVEFCQISTINDFFAKFGTITNISVQPHAQKAVIQYSTRAEAENAYNSPDAIFDNRFVKVYWHKDESATANPAPIEPPVPVLPKSNEPDPELVAARAAELAKEREEKQRKHQEHMKTILEIQKKRELQLQQQIDEQKRLLSKLTNSTGMTQSEKAELLKALKSIQNDIDTSKTAAAAGAEVSHDANTTTTATTTDAANDATEVKEGAETSEDLKKKLARLEAEAAILGMSGPGFRGGRGGYFGRGRGGSWPGMRGGATRMSLDNRPTKIVVKDIPQDSTEPELRQHFEQFGTITSFEQKDSEVLVQYGQRFEAEKAMKAGTNYTKGTLQLAWITDTTEES